MTYEAAFWMSQFVWIIVVIALVLRIQWCTNMTTDLKKFVEYFQDDVTYLNIQAAAKKVRFPTLNEHGSVHKKDKTKVF